MTNKEAIDWFKQHDEILKFIDKELGESDNPYSIIAMQASDCAIKALECINSSTFKDGYNKGRTDREEEIIKMIKDIKLKAFLTIANTKNESLDATYEVLGDTLDKLLMGIKEPKDENCEV